MVILSLVFHHAAALRALRQGRAALFLGTGNRVVEVKRWGCSPNVRTLCTLDGAPPKGCPHGMIPLPPHTPATLKQKRDTKIHIAGMGTSRSAECLNELAGASIWLCNARTKPRHAPQLAYEMVLNENTLQHPNVDFGL